MTENKKEKREPSDNELTLTALSIHILIDYCRVQVDGLKAEGKPIKHFKTNEKLNDEKYQSICNALKREYGFNFFTVSAWDGREGAKPINKVGFIGAVLTPITKAENEEEAEFMVSQKLAMIWFDFPPEDIKTDYMACDSDTGKNFAFCTSWVQWVNEID
jgi:hypothetical protein